MQLGIHVGTDVESVAEVEAALQRYGTRYSRRLFTDYEIDVCGPVVASAAPRLTARFAAKEAVIKLLAPNGVIPRWRSIEVRADPGGAPRVRLRDEAAELARARGIDQISLSMSHGANIGTATAVALSTGPASRAGDDRRHNHEDEPDG